MAEQKPKEKNRQLSMSEYQVVQSKRGKKKKLIEFPKSVFYVIAAPLAILILLLLIYVFYVRRFTPQGS